MALPKLKIPFFSRGTYEELRHHLESPDGVYYELDRILYHYVTEGEYAGSLILVYANKTIHFIKDSELESVVSDLTATVESHTQDLATISAVLTELQGTVEDLGGTVATNTSDIAALKTSITTLSTAVEEMGDVVQDVDERFNSIEGDVGDLKTSVSSLDTRLEGVEDSVITHSLAIQSLEGTVDAHETSIASLQGDMTVVKGDVNSLKTDVADNKSAIAGLQNDVEAIELDIEQLRATTFTKTQIEDMVGDTEGKSVTEYVDEKVNMIFV